MLKEYLRKVDCSDMELLYKWANDPDVRANAFDSAPISLEVHRKWFKEKLASSNALIFVYHCNDKDIGQVRLDTKDDIALIDYSIDFSFRGKGYGCRMMRLLEKKVCEERPEIKCLRAQVKFENESSQKVFRKLDYIEIIKINGIEFSKNVISQE